MPDKKINYSICGKGKDAIRIYFDENDNYLGWGETNEGDPV